MLSSPWNYFSDAVLRAPTIGCMLMCLAAALVGVVVFLRKQSLVGEALSHAAYPGVIIGVLIAAALSIDVKQELAISLFYYGRSFLQRLIGSLADHFNGKKTQGTQRLCFMFYPISFFWNWLNSSQPHSIHRDSSLSANSGLSLWSSCHDD